MVKSAVERFLHTEAAGGALLLASAALSLGLANSRVGPDFLALWQRDLSIGSGAFALTLSFQHWINDALMAVFFFVIGLEVKRELVLGELRDARRAVLPLAAAAGGMLAPAGLYLLLQGGGPAARGFGVPMATDIAFAVGCLAVLGARVPPALRILLLSLAIADDVGAILVIAIGYTQGVHVAALVLGLLGVGAVWAALRLCVRSAAGYGLAGVAVWLAFHESGVHATLAGVLLGLVTPARPTRRSARDAGRGDPRSPVERLERLLHPWVSFGILPLFALANAGVAIEGKGLAHPVAWAVAAGLVIGKPLGIGLVSWLAVRAGLATLPPGVGWGALAGVGALAGIGFTMALFIAGLAFEGPLLDVAKAGILTGSAVSALVGLCVLALVLPPLSGDRSKA